MVLLFAAACARGGDVAPGVSAPGAPAPVGGSAGDAPAAAASTPASGAGGAAPASGPGVAIQVPPTKVRVAYTVVTGGVAPIWLAADNGLWAQHGLDVDLTLISGTPT